MKKTFLFIMLLLSATFTVSAQFRINSNGYLSFNTTATPSSPISLNYGGNSEYFMACNAGTHNGLYCQVSGKDYLLSTYGGYFYVKDFKVSNYHIGVRVRTIGSSQDFRPSKTFGVMSEATHGNSSFGVLGSISDCQKGAAIYGTVYGDFGNTDTHLYAGYFNGDAKVTGDLTVGGSIQGTLLNVSPTISELNNGEACLISSGSLRSVGESLSALSVATIKKEKPIKEKASQDVQFTESKSEEAEEEFPEQEIDVQNKIEEQYFAKQHYALIADQLEEIFPDLVYEKEDGTKAVNYVEMIPLLVQSINELSSRLATLESENAQLARKTNSKNEVSAVETVPATVSATLTQNTPNPFTERTTIRFTLPEDAQNAYIYIFDMMGKMQKQITVDNSMQSVTINGYELSAGMYIYSLVVNGKEIDTKRMILSK